MQTLQLQLDESQAAFRAQMPAASLAVVDQSTRDLAGSGVVDTALQVGDHIANFSLTNQNGKSKNLSDFLNAGPLVISFYRGGWCPYCNIELAALQKVLPEIEAAGARLIAITPETPDHSLSTAAKHALAFDVLSDQGNGVARQFGLEFALPEELRQLYVNFGIDLPARNGDDSFTLPMPATYVVGADGNVIYRFVDADYTKRAEPSDLLKALQGMAAGAPA
jgi:peroxiredoxin